VGMQCLGFWLAAELARPLPHPTPPHPTPPKPRPLAHNHHPLSQLEPSPSLPPSLSPSLPPTHLYSGWPLKLQIWKPFSMAAAALTIVAT
jgi:hypothetical protein